MEECPEEVDAVKKREITGAEFLAKHCDGKFTDEDLNDLGNEFSSKFYENDYFDIYLEAANPSDQYATVYHIPNSWETYEKVAPKISHAFDKWNRENQE